jgi:hypothetical protein
MLAACSHPTGGTARPAEVPQPPTSAPRTTTSVVPASAIAGKLLTRNELAGIIADTDLKENATFTKPDYITDGVDPPECGVRVLADNTFAYSDDQLAAMAGNNNVGAGGKRAAQVVSIWAAAKKAKDTVAMAGNDWGSCKEGQSFTVTADNGTQQWIAGPITITVPRITTTAQRQQPTPRTCSHVMASQINVVVEAVACGADGDISGQANQIADRILAKFPQ